MERGGGPVTRPSAEEGVPPTAAELGSYLQLIGDGRDSAVSTYWNSRAESAWLRALPPAASPGSTPPWHPWMEHTPLLPTKLQLAQRLLAFACGELAIPSADLLARIAEVGIPAASGTCEHGGEGAVGAGHEHGWPLWQQKHLGCCCVAPPAPQLAPAPAPDPDSAVDSYFFRMTADDFDPELHLTATAA